MGEVPGRIVPARTSDLQLNINISDHFHGVQHGIHLLFFLYHFRPKSYTLFTSRQQIWLVRPIWEL